MRQLLSVLGLLCLAGAPLTAFSQDLNISGKVSDKEGAVLPGVSVTVKGTTVYQATNGEGKFNLRLKGYSEATVIFSYLGFKTVEQTVNKSTSDMNITLEEAPLDIMEDMVVTGFATSVKRKNLANSVASLKAEDLSRVATQTVDGALSAKFTGVTVSSNTGAPGGGMSVKLRGQSTLNGKNQPLYVVDGILVSNIEVQSGLDLVTRAAGAGSSRPQGQPVNRIADLVASDIESIEVLKGPSAAAIYGSKASNGVVIITTKKGSVGDTVYNITQGFGTRKMIQKLGYRQFDRDLAVSAFGELGGQLWDASGGANIDYEDEIYGNEGAISETTFSARGGSEKTTFYFGGSHLSDEGIVERTGYEKSSIRLNLEHHMNASMTIGLNTSFVRSISDRGITGNDNSGTTFGVALSATPHFVDLRPVDGIYPDNPFATNFLHTRDVMQNEETTNRTINSVNFDWNVYQSNSQILDFKLVAGVDFFSLEHDLRFPNELQFERASEDQAGTSILGETESRQTNVHFNLTHTFITGDYTFRTTGGLQYERQDVNQVTVQTNGLIEGQFNVDQGQPPAVFATRTLEKTTGYFIQEEINIGEAVFATVGVRGDSGSPNGDGEKFYTYPKASVSVRLSEYDFWEPASDWFNEFKVRAAWGRTGNLPLPRTKYDLLVSSTIEGQVGLLPSSIKGNPDIKPETSEELDIGFDATIKDGLATVEFSYFKQEITDLILRAAVRQSSGFTATDINGGEMEIDGTLVSSWSWLDHSGSGL